MKNAIRKGALFALLTATISGFSIFYNRQVIVKGIDPLIFNIIKNGGVALILSLFLLSRIGPKQLIRRVESEWKKLLIIAIIGGSIPFYLFFEGLKQTSAINATLIHKTMFVWVAAIALPLLSERLSLLQITGFIAVAYGNLFIGGFSGFSHNKGELLIAAATLFWALEAVLVRKF